MRRQAWSGWGPSQFPKRHKVAGWDWDDHLNGFVTHARRDFECSCGESISVPEYRNCRCGKVWNTYAIGTGPDTRTANADLFIAREIPVREGVIVANRRPRRHAGPYDLDPNFGGTGIAGGEELMQPKQIEPLPGFNPGGGGGFAKPRTRSNEGSGNVLDWIVGAFQDEFARDIVDTVPDTDEQARYVNYLNRWENMRRNEQLQYRPGSEVAGWQDYHPAPVGTWDGMPPKPKAARRYAAEVDSADYILEGFQDWLMTQGDSLESLKQNPSALEAKLREYMADSPTDHVYEVMDRVAGRELTPSERDLHNQQGWRGEPCEDPSHHGNLSGRCPECGRRVAAMPPGSIGKTPGGPAGSGTEGLKQKTRYRGYTTPQLRALRQRMLSQQNRSVDMGDLLRELSFREVIGVLHDLSAAGGTPADEGTKTKRTDPIMSAPDDWHHRDQGGRWTRGDGHVTGRRSR